MMKFIQKVIIRPISNMKLLSKMLLSYFLLIIVPFSIFTFISDQRVSDTIENLVKYTARQSFEQSNAFISYKLKKIIDVQNAISVDSKINSTLAKNPDSLDIPTQIRYMNEMSEYLKSFQNNDEIYNVKLYINDNFINADEKVNFLGLRSIIDTSCYKELQQGHGKNIWFLQQPDKNSLVYDNGTLMDPGKKISALRLILDSNNYLHIIGVIRIDILEDNLNEILAKTSSTKNSVTYIQNSKDQIISSPANNIKAEWKLKSSVLKSYTKRGSYFNQQELDSKKVLFVCQPIENTDWTLVSITPYNEIQAMGKNIRNEMLLFFLVIGTASYCVAYIISFSITKRIRLLIINMRNIKNGNFNTEVVSNSTDEIGELIHNFNDMSNQLSFLVKEQVRIGQEAKNSELLALQAQINPHFLYNTLDLINWTAISNNVQEISATVQSLSKFYKLSLSKGKNIIPIRDEIEHVKMFIDIQNRRFNNIFTFLLDIDEKIFEYTTIKIILQPIVENAIIHGILQKAEKKGTIRLKGTFCNDLILFTIKDDGIGMSSEQIDNIFAAAKTQSCHGYGIKNIDDRIKLAYGEQYGLSYSSVPSGGTTVEIRILAQKVTALMPS
jgi:two-component system, sensor histidine kinase YesM